MNEIVLKRLVIYPKDIAKMTGKTPRTCRRILQQIKTKLNKEKHDLVSIDEFCQITGFTFEHVAPFLIS